MAENLRFKSCYHVERVKPNMVFLFSENQHHLLKGSIYYHLVPYLKKGNFTADELVDKLEKKASATEIFYALDRLEKKGYLHGEAPLCNKSTEAFFELLGVSPKKGMEKLTQTKIFVKSLSKSNKKPFLALLKDWNIQIVENVSEADLCVVITQDYLDGKLKAFNDEVGSKPWLLVKPEGTSIWIGPLFDLEKKGLCWECLAKRIKNNRMEESFVQIHNETEKPYPVSIASLKSTRTMAFQLAVNEILKWIVLDKTSPLEAKLVTLDLLSLKMEDHPIQFPKCSCKEECKAVLQPLVLQSFKKEEHIEGGTRCFTPEYTLKKNIHLVSPITGIVSNLDTPSELNDSCLHVYVAGHNFAMSNAYKGVKANKLRQSSGGKGKTELQAKAGGLCEAIERYCGVFQRNEHRIKGSYQELKDQAIHPKDILHYSDKQYEIRKEWNKNSSSMHWTPVPYSETDEIEWTPAWSLTEQKHKYLPTSFCYYGYNIISDATICFGDSNGNAAGNLIEEAILQGFFELVERDCVAMWWYNRVQRPLVDLASFKDPYFTAIVQEYKKREREIWVLDLTNDLKIPTFAAMSRKLTGKRECISLGFGTHFDPSIAALRALTEMNQLLSAAIAFEKSSGEEEQIDDEDSVGKKWFEEATWENQPFLQPLKDHPPTTPTTYPNEQSTDILHDVQRCQKIVEDLGMEMLVLDQSRPEANLKVVKVVVPGIRHFWPRFAPGRLYDVPVKLGWLEKPLQESELNPIPVFF